MITENIFIKTVTQLKRDYRSIKYREMCICVNLVDSG